ncbi:MAG: TrmB family transcriptional regulator [Candidatus Woesearchaeota archaeon]
MIVKEEFLSKLRRYFSLNLYEVKIWAALLSRGVSTAGELSDIANVPRSRSYDVLESLEKKGFVVMKLGKPIKYIAVPPTEVLERVKKNMKLEAEEKIKRLSNLKDTEVLQELNSLHAQGVELIEPADLSGSLRGRHNLYNHLELTIKNAEQSVQMMTTAQGLMRKLEGLKGTFEEIKKKGVKIKIGAPVTEESMPLVKEMEDIVEVRHTNSRARFCIVDNKELIFMVLNDADVHPTYDVGIWVNTPFFANALSNLFSMAWDDMDEIKGSFKPPKATAQSAAEEGLSKAASHIGQMAESIKAEKQIEDSEK